MPLHSTFFFFQIFAGGDNFQEGQTGTITIDPEIDTLTLRHMVEFMYGEELSDEQLGSPMLFYAADIYEVEGLRDLCEAKIAAKINVGNAADVLLLAVK